MANFALRSRISSLPSPELIATLDKSGLSDLRVRVERLQFDIDNAKERRVPGDALRRKMRTGLPPRLSPILDDPPSMDETAVLSDEEHAKAAKVRTWYKRAITNSLPDAISEPGIDFPLTDDQVQYEPSAACPVCGANEIIPIPHSDKVKCVNCGIGYAVYAPGTQKKRTV